MSFFWDFFWLLVWGYFLLAYLTVLFLIIADVFRDRELGGFSKAVWMVALIVVPLLTAVVYVISRGRGMVERKDSADRQAREQTDRHIRHVANRPSAADQIATAKALRDDGTITEVEFEGLKAKALAV